MVFYLKYVVIEFFHILFYQDRRFVIVNFKNCTLKADMGDSEASANNLNKFFVKTLKKGTVDCIINGHPGTATYTYLGTLKFNSDQEINKEHPYFNLDFKI